MAKMLTEEDIRNANSYIPLDRKVSLADAIADLCIAKVEVTATDDVEGDGRKVSLPYRYTENAKLRILYQMVVLLQEYLKQDIKSEGFNADDYDEWGKSAIFNQLDRFKQSKDSEIRNKVYDILDDYRELCKLIGAELSSKLQLQNDPMVRIMAFISTKLPPELIAKLRESLDSAKNEVEEYRKKKESNK